MDVEFCQMLFMYLLNDYMIFILHFVNVICIIGSFLDFETTLAAPE